MKEKKELDKIQFLAAAFRLPLHVTRMLFGIIGFRLQIERKRSYNIRIRLLQSQINLCNIKIINYS